MFRRMDLKDVFASNLRYYRHERGLSQETVAYEAEINRTYISKLEQGISQPGLEIIAKLAAVLRVKPFMLLKPRTSKGGRHIRP